MLILYFQENEIFYSNTIENLQNKFHLIPDIKIMVKDISREEINVWIKKLITGANEQYILSAKQYI